MKLKDVKKIMSKADKGKTSMTAKVGNINKEETGDIKKNKAKKKKGTGGHLIEKAKRKLKKKKSRIYLDTEGSKDEVLNDQVESEVQNSSLKKPKKREAEIDVEERKLAEELFGEVDHSLYNINVESRFKDVLLPDEENEDDVSTNKDDLELADLLPKKRKPAWTDEDDLLSFKVAVKRKKKKGYSGKNHEDFMKQVKDNFQQAFGDDPEWAKLPEERANTSKVTLRQSTGLYLASKEELAEASNVTLPKTALQFTAMKDLNGASRTEGSVITGCEFNPKFEVALVCGKGVGGFGAASLFQVDGNQNHKIDSLKFPHFPVNCGRFLECGTKFIVGSNFKKDFYLYDMDACKQTKIPWNYQDAALDRGYFEVSRCGRWIAFRAKFGQVDIYDGRLLTYIGSLKLSGEVTSFAFSPDGDVLYTHSDLGKVYVFDVSSRRCLHSFYDSGCLSGTSIDISCKGVLACGSSSGIVNIYNKSEFMKSSSPLPVKALDKLVTDVSEIKFNYSGEILATYSNATEEAFKLVHLPSATYFANFPGRYTFQRVNSICFSPSDGYMSVGTNRGVAKLFRLSHFAKF